MTFSINDPVCTAKNESSRPHYFFDAQLLPILGWSPVGRPQFAINPMEVRKNQRKRFDFVGWGVVTFSTDEQLLLLPLSALGDCDFPVNTSVRVCVVKPEPAYKNQKADGLQ
jgi:hypothetical protein